MSKLTPNERAKDISPDEPHDGMNAKTRIKKQIESLTNQIEYEEAMYQTALEHPTDTHQFRKALEDNRIRIDKLHEELQILLSPPISGNKS